MFVPVFVLKMNGSLTRSWVTVTDAELLSPGDSSIWDKGGDESQLLFERCRQPHSFHQNQNQCPQWGPVHHPPCRGGGHIRWTFKPLWSCITHTIVHLLWYWMFFWFCSPWYILLHRDAWLWYAAITRWGVLQKKQHLIFLCAFSLTPPFSLSSIDRPKLLNLHLLNSGTKDVPITVSICSRLFISLNC